MQDKASVLPDTFGVWARTISHARRNSNGQRGHARGLFTNSDARPRASSQNAKPPEPPTLFAKN